MTDNLPAPREEASGAVARAQAFEIKTADDFAVADGRRVVLLGLKKAIVADFKDAKAKAKAAHQAVCDQESGHLRAVDDADAVYEAKMKAWRAAREAEDRELARRAQAEARRAAEDEQVREAAAAEAAGDSAAAEAILAQPATAAPVVLPTSIPKSKSRLAANWKYRVTAPAAVPDEFWSLDEAKIGKRVRDAKVPNPIPGVEAWPE